MDGDKGKKVSVREYKGYKGNLQYISSITGCVTRLSNLSKSVVKRKIVELMAVKKKEGENCYKEPKKIYPWVPG